MNIPESEKENMKTRLIRRFFILIAVLLIVAGISSLLYRASYEPDFTIMDALTYATKHSRKKAAEKATETDTVVTWSYSAGDLVLPEGAPYEEKTINTGEVSYVVLRKTDLPEGTLRILSVKGNQSYEEAVGEVAAYYEDAGYDVEIREYSETMMLSLAHAEHFDLFLLREEAGK